MKQRIRAPGLERSRSARQGRRNGHAPVRLFLAIIWLTSLFSTFTVASLGSAQSTGGEVYIVTISQTIDLGLAPYLERVLDEAEDANAAAVILEIDTPGGRLDAVLQMKDALLGSSVRTIAFVNRTAFSAGALVAIASNEIYMTSGAVMGAATPIDGGTGDTASEKVVSAVRSTFASTAEARGRDPLIAEAMVDESVEVPGLSPAGQLLTLTTTDALAWNYANGTAETREQLLAVTGLSGAPVVETSMSFAERATRFITDPIVAGLLLTFGLLLIIGDFFVDGLGLMAIAGVILIAAFFWGHLVAGIAGWEDIALVAAGLLLIGIELFVVPGFGVPGILGLIALLGGVFLAMIGREIRSPDAIERALITVTAVLVFFVLGFIILLALLPRRARFGGTVLRSTVTGGPDAGARPPVGWLRWFGGVDNLPVEQAAVAPRISGRDVLTGKTGRTVTPLRPSGSAEIDGERIDVVTEGEFIAQGEPVVVILDEGYRRVVRRYNA
jgi:membrane-bound serine protease (ClpP class)